MQNSSVASEQKRKPSHQERMESLAEGQEKWRAVPGYEGRYSVSNFGRVLANEKSFMRKNSGLMVYKERIMKTSILRGYHRVTLRKNNRPRLFGVHRLVAMAFIPNPMSKKSINHKDFDRANNRVENLEWVTNQENTKHSLDHNRFPSGEKNLNSIPLSVVRGALKMINDGEKYLDIGPKLGISLDSVYQIAHGRHWSCQSFGVVARTGGE